MMDIRCPRERQRGMFRFAIDCRLYSQTGVGRYIRAILAALKKEARQISRTEYFLIAYRPDLKYFQELPPNIKIIPTSARWHSFTEQVVIPYLLLKHKINLVHFPYFNVPIICPVKFLLTIHDLTINKFKTGKATTLPAFIYFLKRIFYHLTVWLAVLRAEKIFTVSNSVKSEIMKIYHVEESRIVVIYNGSELEDSEDGRRRTEDGNQKTEDRESEKLGKRVYRNYILYVGNLHPHKNLETLIVAFDLLIREQEFKNWRLVIVSPFDFFYRQLFALLIKLKLETKVDFTGPVANARLADLYKNAFCFVLPSYSEGFGIPGVEAMRLRCPVLASDISVFHEIYGPAAIYFNPKNAVELKEKILTLQNAATRREYQEKGYAVAQKYSWHKMGEKVISIYKNLCSKK